MEAADEELTRTGVRIHARAFHAFRLLVPEYVGSVLGSGVEPRDYPPLVGPNLLQRICDWYQARYGDRVNLPSDRGRVPIVIRREVYLVRIPLVFGNPQVPILPLIEGLTESMAESLTEGERVAIKRAFEQGFALTHEIEDLKRELEEGRVSLSSAAQSILTSAIADRDTAVRCLAERDTNVACFHGQQYAEKMLKVYLLSKNVSTEEQLSRRPYGHDLRNVLGLCIATSGYFVILTNDIGLLANIPMDIRYTVADVGAETAVETVWSALRVGGFCAWNISARPRRYRE